jgi:hypothetical protein
MFFYLSSNRFAAGLLAGAGGVVTSGAVVALVTHPAVAASAFATVQSAVTCAVTGTNSCVSGTNTSSGIGVLGASNTGTGVRGTSNTNYGIKGSSGSSYGIFGTSASGDAGLAGTTASKNGVYGYTTSNSGGTGVYGSSHSFAGVYGTTTSGLGIGVFGYETGSGVGVYGESSSGYGIGGFADSSGAAVHASAMGSATGISVAANIGDGIDVTSKGNYGIFSTAGYAGGFFSGGSAGVLARSTGSGGIPLLLEGPSGTVFYVDDAGNIYAHGSLHPLAVTAGGTTVTAFSPTATAPTVEDSGSAQLVGGVAAVRLDPAFAATIDPRSGYRVFLTPGGDTRGLFIASKSPAGFVVRESQGGRASVSFDYRILATTLGEAGQRMTPSLGLRQFAVPAAQKQAVIQRPVRPEAPSP